MLSKQHSGTRVSRKIYFSDIPCVIYISHNDLNLDYGLIQSHYTIKYMRKFILFQELFCRKVELLKVVKMYLKLLNIQVLRILKTHQA